MTIETSININKRLYKKLENASQRLSMPKSLVIVHLLKKVRKNRKLEYLIFNRVKYQEKMNRAQWKCLHLTVLPNNYEIMTDMRKVYKKSVSFLIAIGILYYLDKIINDSSSFIYSEVTDNYTVIVNEDENKILCWKIYWGFPKNLTKMRV